MRRAWSRSASTVMVMRDTSGFSVRPTVSESILKARRRNSEATRVSTPGLFSTYTMNVFSMFFSFVVRSLDNRAGPPNHIVQRSAGRDHRINGVFLFNLKIDQHRPLVLARRLDGGHDLRTLRDSRAPDAISLGQPCKIRIKQGRCRVVAVVEKFLPLPHHAEIAIVDDGDMDLQIFLHQRRQFAHGHLESAIAHHHPY